MKAIVRIYELQTSEERERRSTCKWNGVGFRHNDAMPMSRICEKLLRQEMPTKDEVWHCINAAKYYSKQLAMLSGKKSALADAVEKWLRSIYNHK